MSNDKFKVIKGDFTGGEYITRAFWRFLETTLKEDIGDTPIKAAGITLVLQDDKIRTFFMPGFAWATLTGGLVRLIFDIMSTTIPDYEKEE